MSAARIEHRSSEDIRISFPGGTRVDATLGSHTIHTDQRSEHGGGGAGPEPFELFLASLATCAGYYVLAFCRSRGIPTDEITLVQHHEIDEASHRLNRVGIEIRLPPQFPERWRAAVVQAALGCKVKKTLLAPPEIAITTTDASSPLRAEASDSHDTAPERAPWSVDAPAGPPATAASTGAGSSRESSLPSAQPGRDR